MERLGSRRAWGLLVAGLLIACGNTTRSGDFEPEPEPAATAGSSPEGGASSGGLGASAGAAGRPNSASGGSTASGAPAGETTAGGAPAPAIDPGPVDLCLDADDIPESWGAGGAADVGIATCTVGRPGTFAFNGCRYELLGMPFDVDPFVGGHAHCCYRSKLVSCP